MPETNGASEGSILTEDANDAKVNCLDRAVDYARGLSDGQRKGAGLVFLNDKCPGEGRTGHAALYGRATRSWTRPAARPTRACRITLLRIRNTRRPGGSPRTQRMLGDPIPPDAPMGWRKGPLNFLGADEFPARCNPFVPR